MANNILKSWLGGFQTPTPIPEPTPVPTPAPSSYQRSIDNIKRLLPYLTNAQARDYATQEQILTTTFHQGGFLPRDYATRLQALYNKFAVYGWTKSTPEPTPEPTPAPELRPYPTPGLLRRRSEAAARWQKRQRTLSNYPRLPQSTIPIPAVEYPAPGRPPGPSKPGYTNPFAWRRKNNGWW